MRSFGPGKAIAFAMMAGLSLAAAAQFGGEGGRSPARAASAHDGANPRGDVTGSITPAGAGLLGPATLALRPDADPVGVPAAALDPRRILSIVGLGLFATGAVLLILLGWHNRQLRGARDRAEALARDLAGLSNGLERANAEITKVNAELKSRNDNLGRRDREMGLQNRRFDAALNNMSQALCMVDTHDRLVVFNRRFGELFAVEVAPIPGILLDDLVALASSPLLSEVQTRQHVAAAAGLAAGFALEAADGRTIQVSHQPMPEGGWVATYEDVTERREAQARITFLAHHDAATGLLNRAAFERRIAAALESDAEPFAVHLLDIAGLKDVNDGYGHPTGDALLREAGRRLSDCAVPSGAVARIGGDEFAILRPAGDDRTAEAAFADGLVKLIGESFDLDGRSVAVGAGVGVAIAPADGSTADALLTNAYLALGQAKLAGRDRVRLFEPDMDAARRARRALERDLRGALGRGEIELFFQPLVDARRVALAGFETLARWRHPARGLVSPSDFIPVAEETGLIVEIGAHVLREACRYAAAWRGGLTVAVNLSPAQFAAPDLIGTLDDALRRSGLEPARLEVEITESLPLGDGDGALAILHAIRSRGVRIAMDDFGTGYASLSYLRRFPFDKIKIDQSFVRDLSSRPDCIKIVSAMAALAASLGMSTTAEGVETPEEFALLRDAGCDHLQGFHFGRPQSAESLNFTLPAAVAALAVAAAFPAAAE